MLLWQKQQALKLSLKQSKQLLLCISTSASPPLIGSANRPQFTSNLLRVTPQRHYIPKTAKNQGLSAQAEGSFYFTKEGLHEDIY